MKYVVGAVTCVAALIFYSGCALPLFDDGGVPVAVGRALPLGPEA